MGCRHGAEACPNDWRVWGARYGTNWNSTLRPDGPPDRWTAAMMHAARAGEHKVLGSLCQSSDACITDRQ